MNSYYLKNLLFQCKFHLPFIFLPLIIKINQWFIFEHYLVFFCRVPFCNDFSPKKSPFSKPFATENALSVFFVECKNNLSKYNFEKLSISFQFLLALFGGLKQAARLSCLCGQRQHQNTNKYTWNFRFKAVFSSYCGPRRHFFSLWVYELFFLPNVALS